LLFLSALQLSSSVEAQTPVARAGVRQQKTIFHYSFNGATSLQQVDSLKAEILQLLPEVISFKARFKPENKQAELTLVVVEYFPRPESRCTFNAVTLKTLILRHGYDPVELTYYYPEK